MKYSVVIPARMASSRFPGKPLEKIAGLPMIEHVRRRALLVPGVADVIVATCDEEIKSYIESQKNGKAIMTSKDHERCTARVAEAAMNFSSDVVVVVQGDEPLLFPDSIIQAIEPFKAGDSCTCVSLLSPLESEADYLNPNIVKASCDREQKILYFSRSPIPYFMKKTTVPVFRETGIRALRHDFLLKYLTLPEGPLEIAESVDMFRLLENGYSIRGVKTDYATMGVDHREDIEIAEKHLKNDFQQKEFLQQIL